MFNQYFFFWGGGVFFVLGIFYCPNIYNALAIDPVRILHWCRTSKMYRRVRHSTSELQPNFYQFFTGHVLFNIFFSCVEGGSLKLPRRVNSNSYNDIPSSNNNNYAAQATESTTQRLPTTLAGRERKIAPIGAWKWNFPPFQEIMTDGQTDRRDDKTDRWTDGLIGKLHFLSSIGGLFL